MDCKTTDINADSQVAKQGNTGEIGWGLGIGDSRYKDFRGLLSRKPRLSAALLGGGMDAEDAGGIRHLDKGAVGS
jgi:hypothetical protein